MEGIELLIAGSVLVWLPPWVARRGRLPATSTRAVTIVSMVVGGVMLLSAFAICGAAMAEEVVGLEAADGHTHPFRHLVPEVPHLGLVSLLVVVVALGRVAFDLHATWRRRRHLRHVLAELGPHDPPGVSGDGPAGDPGVITLDTSEIVAAAVPGSFTGSDRIVVSRGVRERLGPDELAAVIAHERAHLSRHHHRDLVLARAVDRALWFVPGARRATSTLRHSLEREADEQASLDVGDGPTRRALAALGGSSGRTPCGSSGDPATGTAGSGARVAGTAGVAVAGAVGACWLLVGGLVAMSLVFAVGWLG